MRIIQFIVCKSSEESPVFFEKGIAFRFPYLHVFKLVSQVHVVPFYNAHRFLGAYRLCVLHRRIYFLVYAFPYPYEGHLRLDDNKRVSVFHLSSLFYPLSVDVLDYLQCFVVVVPIFFGLTVFGELLVVFRILGEKAFAVLNAEVFCKERGADFIGSF